MSDVPVPGCTGPTIAPEPNGIRGWLLVFAISISILSPILLLRSCSVFFKSAARFHRSPVIAVFQIAGWSELVIGLLYIGVGILIFQRRRQANVAVPLALAFGALSGITLWSLYLFLPFDAPIRARWETEMMRPMLQRMFYAVLWGSYWMSSTRVANTFRHETISQS